MNHEPRYWRSGICTCGYCDYLRKNGGGVRRSPGHQIVTVNIKNLDEHIFKTLEAKRDLAGVIQTAIQANKLYDEVPFINQEHDMSRKKGSKKTGRTLGQALLSGDIKYAGQVEVRGGYYHNMWEAKVDGQLAEGAWLSLKREPNNEHDANAISVWVKPKGMVPQRIGYVAKEQAVVYAPLMDIGVKAALRVFSHSCGSQPLRLTARLYIKR